METTILENFIKVKSKEIAYLLGFLWADGYVYIKNKRYCVGIGIQKSDFDPYIKKLLKTENWRISYWKQEKRKEQGRARLYNKKVALYLKSLGYCEKNETAEKIISTIPKKLKRYWFRGLFDGDGCVYISKKGREFSVVICGPYNQDWNDMIKLCRELEIKKWSIKKNKHKSGKNSQFRIRNMVEIIKFLSYIYDDFENDTIGFKRKYDKFKYIENYYQPPSSAYKGLSITPSKTWQVRMCQGGYNIFVGTFKSEKEGSEAYNKKAVELLGDKAILNTT